MGCSSTRQTLSSRYDRPAHNAVAYPAGKDDKIIVSIREVKSQQGYARTEMEAHEQGQSDSDILMKNEQNMRDSGNHLQVKNQTIRKTRTAFT